jgi:hypothetical protein
MHASQTQAVIDADDAAAGDRREQMNKYSLRQSSSRVRFARGCLRAPIARGALYSADV